MTCSFVNVSYIAFLTSTDMNVVKGSVTSKVKDIKCIALIEHGSCFFFLSGTGTIVDVGLIAFIYEIRNHSLIIVR